MPDDALTDEQKAKVAENIEIARNHVRSRYKRIDPLWDDLEQAAATGLMNAVRTHDPDEYDLETHAYHKMRDEINRMFQSKRLIRVPRHVAQAVIRGDFNVPYALDAARAMMIVTVNPLDSVEAWASRHQRRAEDREREFAMTTAILLAIKKLPKLDRDVIYRKFAGNQSNREIGAAHNRTREWARLRIAAALNKIRETMMNPPKRKP